jgi:hypothetical protein
LCRAVALAVGDEDFSHSSIHGCVDFLLVAHVIFVSFSGYFVRFACAACSSDSGVFEFEFVDGDHG